MNKFLVALFVCGCACFSCSAQETEEIVKEDEVSTSPCQEGDADCMDQLISYAYDCGCNKDKGKGK